MIPYVGFDGSVVPRATNDQVQPILGVERKLPMMSSKGEQVD
jgi:hypothetical protein